MVTSTCIYLSAALLSISNAMNDGMPLDKSAPHSTTLKSNFKLKFCDSFQDYATSKLSENLHSFIVSLWLNCSSDINGNMFRYINVE